MKKITKLTDLQQIDGRVHDELNENPKEVKAQSTKITRLEQLMNKDVGFNKYGTLDADVYQSQLEGMNLAELRSHVNHVAGMVAAGSREKIIKQCLGVFRKHVASFNVPDHSDSNASLSQKKASLGLSILKAVK